MSPLLLLLLIFSSIPPARARGGSQLLVAIAKTEETTANTMITENTTGELTSTSTVDNCSQTGATGSLENLSCSITDFLSDLQERLLSRAATSPSTSVETWSSKLLTMTWNDAVEVRVEKY